MLRKAVTKVLLMFVFILFLHTAKAQKLAPLRFGIGIDAGSTVNTDVQPVLGVDARLQIPLDNNFSGMVTTGYYHFFNDLKSDFDNSFGIVPVKAGIKYFFVRNVYIGAEAGVGFGTQSGQQSSFVYSPSVGLAFTKGFDVSIKYEDYTKYKGYASQLAIRLAYGFKL